MVLIQNLTKGYKEELMTTAGIVSLCAVASFALLAQSAPKYMSKSTSEAVLGAQSEDPVVEPTIAPSLASSETVLPPSPSPSPSPTPSPSPSASPSATPEPLDNPNTVEIPYGASQDFENNNYLISFSDPKLIVSNSRIFKVNVVVANKDIGEGIDNTLLGVISRDGQVISSRAPLTLSEIKTIKSGEKLTFGASISLPESTQLTQITFDPPGDPLKTTYNLDPTF